MQQQHRLKLLIAPELLKITGVLPVSIQIDGVDRKATYCKYLVEKHQ